MLSLLVPAITSMTLTYFANAVDSLASSYRWQTVMSLELAEFLYTMASAFILRPQVTQFSVVALAMNAA